MEWWHALQDAAATAVGRFAAWAGPPAPPPDAALLASATSMWYSLQLMAAVMVGFSAVLLLSSDDIPAVVAFRAFIRRRFQVRPCACMGKAAAIEGDTFLYVPSYS